MGDPVYGFKANYGRAEVIPIAELDGLEIGTAEMIQQIAVSGITGTYNTATDATPIVEWGGLAGGIYMVTLDGHLTAESAAESTLVPISQRVLVCEGIGNGNSGSGSTTDPSENPEVIAHDKATFNGHTYQVIESGMSWSDAKAYCEAAGGHLVTITSAEEQDFLIGLTGGELNLWIGASLSGSAWSWVTGETWGYTNWADGEPSGGDERYAALWPETWNDLVDDSWEQAGFIIEWDYAEEPDAGDSWIPSESDGEYVVYDAATIYVTADGTSTVPINRVVLFAGISDGESIALRIQPVYLNDSYRSIDGDFEAALTARLYKMR